MGKRKRSVQSPTRVGKTYEDSRDIPAESNQAKPLRTVSERFEMNIGDRVVFKRNQLPTACKLEPDKVYTVGEIKNDILFKPYVPFFCLVEDESGALFYADRFVLLSSLSQVERALLGVFDEPR